MGKQGKINKNNNDSRILESLYRNEKYLNIVEL